MIRPGALAGLRVVELEGVGPAPHCAMLLADLGADVVTVLRTSPVETPVARSDDLVPSVRSKSAVRLDLKSEDGVRSFLELVERADVVIDPLRPGVLERLGVGPGACLELNPALIFARLTGWGQDGPLARDGGHDLTYLALTGVLHSIGRKGHPPIPPPALIADFGGGSLYAALGVLAAVTERQRSGLGQVIDIAMVEAVASLATMYYPMNEAGLWHDERGTNYLDSGAPYYDVYECADRRYLAVAPVEQKFYRAFVEGIGLSLEELPGRAEPANWDRLRELFRGRVATRTRDEWVRHFEGRDACVAPVLTFAEAREHPHNRHRGTFVGLSGRHQAAPHPRLSRTPAAPPEPREQLDSAVPVLDRWPPRG